MDIEPLRQQPPVVAARHRFVQQTAERLLGAAGQPEGRGRPPAAAAAVAVAAGAAATAAGRLGRRRGRHNARVDTQLGAESGRRQHAHRTAVKGADGAGADVAGGAAAACIGEQWLGEGVHGAPPSQQHHRLLVVVLATRQVDRLQINRE